MYLSLVIYLYIFGTSSVLYQRLFHNNRKLLLSTSCYSTRRCNSTTRLKFFGHIARSDPQSSSQRLCGPSTKALDPPIEPTAPYLAPDH